MLQLGRNWQGHENVYAFFSLSLGLLKFICKSLAQTCTHRNTHTHMRLHTHTFTDTLILYWHRRSPAHTDVIWRWALHFQLYWWTLGLLGLPEGSLITAAQPRVTLRPIVLCPAGAASAGSVWNWNQTAGPIRAPEQNPNRSPFSQSLKRRHLPLELMVQLISLAEGSPSFLPLLKFCFRTIARDTGAVPAFYTEACSRTAGQNSELQLFV